LWRYQTTWNILEFKGPTVSPRRGHLESLIELGLGIDRQLRTKRGDARQRHLPVEEVSFWYLANHLGNRYLREAERLLGAMERLESGLWRSRLLGRVVFLVSSIDLAVESDSLPLHIVGQEPLATERAVAQLVVEQPELQQRYGGWMASLHPRAWQEIEAMVRKSGKGLKIDLEPAIEAMGLGRIIDQVGAKRVIEEVGAKRVIEEVGAKRVIEEVGAKRVIEEMGLDGLLANLSLAQRRELKRRL
jgi:hypothetical protein